ncbi:hypothetical protein PI125_g21356 [Phytophthora idaei]|nr:hypothetical protein PI125_g21356 [Phytophthora idaei]KAG3159976.1 hypothetical protein PI126_g7104 [Phytophthora idaei]
MLPIQLEKPEVGWEFRSCGLVPGDGLLEREEESWL